MLDDLDQGAPGGSESDREKKGGVISIVKITAVFMSASSMFVIHFDKQNENEKSSKVGVVRGVR